MRPSHHLLAQPSDITLRVDALFRAGLPDGLVNKVPIGLNMTPQVYTYLMGVTREPQVCVSRTML